MKFEVTKKDLEKALNICMKATPGKHSVHMPILKGVYLEASDNKVTLCTTDMVTTIVTRCPCQVHEEGKAVIFAYTFSEAVRELPESVITIEDRKASVELTCEKTFYSFRKFNLNDFPKIPDLETEEMINLDTDFLGAVFKVAGCVSREEMMTPLTGILLDSRKDRLRFVGTDGFRLAVCEIDSEAKVKAIIPNRVFEIVSDFTGGDLQMNCTENRITFRYNGVPETFVCSQLLSGDFPEYAKAIPKHAKVKISVSSDELTKAIRSMFALGSKTIRLKTTSSENLLQVSCESDEGKGSSVISATVQGEDIELVCNPIFLLDGLKRAAGSEVTLETTSPASPIMIKSDDEYDFIYVFMPMKI